MWTKAAMDSKPLAGIQNPLDKPAVYHAVSVLLDSGSTVMSHTDPLDGFRDEAIIAAAALKVYEAALCRREKEARELVFFEFPFMELTHGFNRSWWESVARMYFGEHLTDDLQTAIPSGVRQTNDFARQNQEATTNFIMHFVSRFDLNLLEHAFSLSAMIAEQRIQALCYPKTVLAAPEGEYSPTNLKSGWGYRNLLGAMYLQMHWLMTSGGDVARCEHWGRIISLAKAPIPGARKPPRHKRFCNEYCRYNHHYQVKKKPAREGASPT